MTPTVETVSGKFVHLLQPQADTIYFDDIAYALSRIARFNGHTLGSFQYSVAQHSLWCAWVAQTHFKMPPATTLKVLLHDAHEAYTGDVVSPLKRQLEYISLIQERLQNAIHDALHIKACVVQENNLISIIDGWAVAIESRYLMSSRGKYCKPSAMPDALHKVWHDPVAPMQAYRMFVQAFARLHSGMEMLSPCA